MERLSGNVRTDQERPEWAAFRQGWREAASRPPVLPPQEAARRVLAGIDRAPRVASRRATAAVVLLALALGWWLAGNLPEATSTTPQVAEAALVLGDGVVLLWLDAETPLYMTLAPPGERDDSEGGS
jgi:ferric-dicitrate binding protein FerR (iron transport regulator)